MAASASHALQLFGVTLIGATPENGIKLALTFGWVIGVTVLGRVLRWLVLKVTPKQFAFWARQIISILGALALVAGVLSIWFNDPARLAQALALVTAGVAFALQRVITAVAGYFVILRGTTFNVGDRIVMGGVRGDVISLNFMQTTILEMGQSNDEQGDKPSMWIHSRQYTGRVVTVSNSKVFDEPIYNYSKDFKFIWEETRLPIPYGSDYLRAEQILLEAARNHTEDLTEIGKEALEGLQRQYDLDTPNPAPKVYMRMTDNWIELTVRYFVRDRGTRDRKDRMAREILTNMQDAGLEVASGTYAIVQVPKLQVVLEPSAKS